MCSARIFGANLRHRTSTCTLRQSSEMVANSTATKPWRLLLVLQDLYRLRSTSPGIRFGGPGTRSPPSARALSPLFATAGAWRAKFQYDFEHKWAANHACIVSAILLAQTSLHKLDCAIARAALSCLDLWTYNATPK